MKKKKQLSIFLVITQRNKAYNNYTYNYTFFGKTIIHFEPTLDSKTHFGVLVFMKRNEVVYFH